jgi:hypothetical protein
MLAPRFGQRLDIVAYDETSAVGHSFSSASQATHLCLPKIGATLSRLRLHLEPNSAASRSRVCRKPHAKSSMIARSRGVVVDVVDLARPTAR